MELARGVERSLMELFRKSAIPDLKFKIQKESERSFDAIQDPRSKIQEESTSCPDGIYPRSKV